MEKQVELLSQPTNYAVVHLPGRSFPGVVVQGDSLHEIVKDLGVMARLLNSGNLEDLAMEIEAMQTQLSDVLANYEQVCSARGIELPYPKS